MGQATTTCIPASSATLASGVLGWGDGQSTSVGAQATNITHIYAADGSYTATLTCTDSDGQSAQTSQPVPTFLVTTASTTTTSNIGGPLPPTGPRPPTAHGSSSGSTPQLGHTVKIAARTQTHDCTRGVLPDRQCSPGAYYSGLTKAVLCSSSFRTGTVRNVSEAEKHQGEIEYGMPAKSYGRTIEIDHIVSLEIGGSNDIANLFPEPGSDPANYHVKDRLENKLHQLVCEGSMSLHAAQTGIAHNWETLYKTVFGVAPNA